MVASRGSKELPTPKKQRMGGLEGTTKRSVRPGLDERVPVVADDGAVEGRDASPPRAPSVGASNDTGDGRLNRQDAAVVGDATAAFRELTVNQANDTNVMTRLPKNNATVVPSPKKRRGATDQPHQVAQHDIDELLDLHDLLAEFGRIELNADLLRAIQRTESHASLGVSPSKSRQDGGSSSRRVLDRAAFERVVACTKLRLVADIQRLREESSGEPSEVLRAVLRQYAVRAVATIAKQDSDEADSSAGSEDTASCGRRTTGEEERRNEAEAEAAAELVRHLSVDGPEPSVACPPSSSRAALAESVSSDQALTQNAEQTSQAAASRGDIKIPSSSDPQPASEFHHTALPRVSSSTTLAETVDSAASSPCCSVAGLAERHSSPGSRLGGVNQPSPANQKENGETVSPRRRWESAPQLAGVKHAASSGSHGAPSGARQGEPHKRARKGGRDNNLVGNNLERRQSDESRRSTLRRRKGGAAAVLPSPVLVHHQKTALLPHQATSSAASGIKNKHSGTCATGAGKGDDQSEPEEYEYEEATAEWGSSLVCADLTINDIGSRYWPFRRSTEGGRNLSKRLSKSSPGLETAIPRNLKPAPEEAKQEEESPEATAGDARFDALINDLVGGLATSIGTALEEEQGTEGATYAAGVQSLVAATAFDDVLRDCSSALQSPVASFGDAV